jgi:hypothetical protein
MTDNLYLGRDGNVATELDYAVDRLQDALDNYIDAAIYHKSGGPDASPARRDNLQFDVVTAIDMLIVVRIRDMVKVG